MRRADHDDVAQIARDQFHAAQDERAHQDLAQLGVGLDQGEQLLAIELDHFAGFADAQTRRSTRRPLSMVPSPENCPAWRLTISVSAFPLGRSAWTSPLSDDEERHRPVADFDEHFAARGRTASSVGGNPRHLLRCQRRKHTLGAGVGCGDGRQQGRVYRSSQP